MIDYEKISEFKKLPPRKGKDALYYYAKETFDITLNRKEVFDVVVLELEGALLKKGINVKPLDPVKPKPKPAPKPHAEPVLEPELVPVPESEKVHLNEFQLEKDFKPTLPLMGYRTGYCMLNYWIYDWIETTPNWKENILLYPRHMEIDTLKSLVYYIKKNGFVTVRESRNSRFIDLF